MARLEGTGKDPLGRYGKGEVFDVREDDPLYEALQEKGWAKKVAPEDDPGKTDSQVANAVVAQGGSHQLQDPVEQEKAKKIGDRALDIVHTGDPDADQGAAGQDPDENAGSDDPLQTTPGTVTAASISSADPERAEELRKAEAKAAAKKD